MTDRDQRVPVLRRMEQRACVMLIMLCAVGVVAQRVSMGPVKIIPNHDIPVGRGHLLIDINRADWPELALLPGIGRTLAHRIVEYRVEHGPFQTPEELLDVRGIGPKKLEAMREWLIFAAPPAKADP